MEGHLPPAFVTFNTLTSAYELRSMEEAYDAMKSRGDVTSELLNLQATVAWIYVVHSTRTPGRDVDVSDDTLGLVRTMLYQNDIFPKYTPIRCTVREGVATMRTVDPLDRSYFTGQYNLFSTLTSFCARLFADVLLPEWTLSDMVELVHMGVDSNGARRILKEFEYAPGLFVLRISIRERISFALTYTGEDGVLTSAYLPSSGTYRGEADVAIVSYASVFARPMVITTRERAKPMDGYHWYVRAQALAEEGTIGSSIPPVKSALKFL